MLGDKWFAAILAAVEKIDGSPEERRSAISRAGKIADSYLYTEQEIVNGVFGTAGSLVAPVLDNNKNLTPASSGSAH